MASTKIEKTADIRFRVELKNRPQVVVYKVRSSDDKEDYDVTIVRGKVNNCSCISRKPCYHMTGVAAKEAEFQARRHQREAAAMGELGREIATEAQVAALAERGSLRREMSFAGSIPMR